MSCAWPLGLSASQTGRFGWLHMRGCRMPEAPFESSPRAHVLSFPGRGVVGLDQLTLARSSTVFNGETEVGHTANVVVFTDNTANGNAAAQAVLQTAEADFQATQQWFGGISLPQG